MAVCRLFVALLFVLAGASYFRGPVSAAPQVSRVEFEDAVLRVQRISVAPGQRGAAENRGDGVLVYLTADLEGRMPRVEAVWQPAGSPPLENRAATRFEAVFVELKAAPGTVAASLIPELAPGIQPDPGRYESYDRREHRFVSLVDNARITVSRHRVPPQRWTEQYHFHPREAVYVYLRGGEVSGSTAHFGYHHTRRGDFDVLPANLFHTFYNGGNDPVDFVAVWPK